MEHKALLATIGLRIKELRKARGWTQEELARRARVTADFLGKAERGDKEPSLFVLHKLATVFDVAPAYLLTPEPDRSTDLGALTALLAGRSSFEVSWLRQFVLFVGEHPLDAGARRSQLPHKGPRRTRTRGRVAPG